MNNQRIILKEAIIKEDFNIIEEVLKHLEVKTCYPYIFLAIQY